MSKPELIQVLGLSKDEHYQLLSKPESTPLLLDIVDVIKSHKSLRPGKVDSFMQTEEIGEASMTLEQKLKKIDINLMDRQETERLIPFKTLEERMIKYKREIEQKARDDLESEIRRLREFELSKLRIEEAQKYRHKI